MGLIFWLMSNILKSANALKILSELAARHSGLVGRKRCGDQNGGNNRLPVVAPWQPNSDPKQVVKGCTVKNNGWGSQNGWLDWLK